MPTDSLSSVYLVKIIKKRVRFLLMKFFKSDEWKILWPFYVSRFIFTLFAFIGPFMIIYFYELGFSFKQISIIFSAFLISPILFEIPTGAIADIYGRKFSVILGYFCFAILTLLVFFTQSFTWLLILFFLMGIATTLESGAYESWMVDLLKFKKKSNLIHNSYIKRNSIDNLGFVLCGLIAALLIKLFSIRSLFLFTSFGICLSIIPLLIWEEHFKKHKSKVKRLFRKTFRQAKEGIHFNLKHHTLLHLLLAGSFFIFAIVLGQLVWQPFLKESGLPVHMLGYLVSLVAFISIFTPFLSKPLLKKIGNEKIYLIWMTLLFIISLGVIYFISSLLGILLIYIILDILHELKGPVSNVYYQKFIPSKMRATVTSFQSMVFSLFGVIAMLIGGVVADIVGPKMTIVYSAFFMIPAVIFYLLIKEKQSLNIKKKKTLYRAK